MSFKQLDLCNVVMTIYIALDATDGLLHDAFIARYLELLLMDLVVKTLNLPLEM